jgi:predicted anti-sigma-YlaC factor YlaD
MMDQNAGIKPTCREVHRLVSEGLDRELSLVERARMKIHLLICQACRNFEGQMEFIRQAMRRMPMSSEEEEK